MKKITLFVKNMAAAALAGAVVVTTALGAVPIKAASMPAVADAAVYRGTVKEIVEDENRTTFLLKQETGTNYGFPTLQVMADDWTQYDGQLSEIQKGNYLEVYYGVDEKNEWNVKRAIQVEKLVDSSMSNFNGLVHQIERNGNTGRMLLKNLDTGMDVLFRYTEETQLFLDMKKVSVGDRLNVYYNGLLTRSIPAQGTALEIRPFDEWSIYRGTITNINKSGDDRVLTLEKAKGTPFPKTMTIKLDGSTVGDQKLAEYKKGDFIEVFYPVERGIKIPAAYTIQKLLGAEALVYQGVLDEIRKNQEKPGNGVLIMKNQDGEEIWFHYSNTTEFKTPLSQLRAGDSLSIYHRGIMALSLPGQGFALEISNYME